MNIAIRPKTWRGEPGFLVSGRDSRGRSVSIFASNRDDAERIRDKVKAGQQTVPSDWRENR